MSPYPTAPRTPLTGWYASGGAPAGAGAGGGGWGGIGILPAEMAANRKTNVTADQHTQRPARPPSNVSTDGGVDGDPSTGPRKKAKKGKARDGASPQPRRPTKEHGDRGDRGAKNDPPASRKSGSRKRQFKYLQDDGQDNGERGDSQEQDEDEGGSEGEGQAKEGRKKVKKACIFCKRSHMPCEEARPCKRW